MKRFTTADLIDPEHHPQFTGYRYNVARNIQQCAPVSEDAGAHAYQSSAARAEPTNQNSRHGRSPDRPSNNTARRANREF